MKIQDISQVITGTLKDHKPENILVAFDIDMTLTQPDHPALFYPAIRKYVEDYKSIMGKLTPEQKDIAATLTTLLFPQRWVEADTLSVVQNLQEKGVKVIACTSTLAGKPTGFEDEIIHIRSQTLKAMGLDLSSPLLDFPSEYIFHSFGLYANGYPTFFQGILSTNGEGNISKAEVLVAFLSTPDYSSCPPKVVFLIDDRNKNLDQCAAGLNTFNPPIEFKGIHYTGADTYAPHDISREGCVDVLQDLANKAKTLFP